MNLGENPTGLRDLPLSHYMLRGMRSNAATQYEELKRLDLEQATVIPLPSGPFRIFIDVRTEKMLRPAGMDRSGLVGILGRGLDVERVDPAKGQTVGCIVGTVDGGRVRLILAHEPDPPASADCRVRLALHQPLIGASDWILRGIWREPSLLPPFARVEAQWREGLRGQSVLPGDAAALLRNLMVMQNCRQDRAGLMHRVNRLASGNTPELAERISTWRQVCELERDLLQVGITRLERAGHEYLLIPEEQETVEEWIEALESEKPEGVNWQHHKLKLIVEQDFALLTIQSIRSESDELLLVVSCTDSKGIALLDRVCDQTERVDEQRASLFLPDSQLNKITDALDWIDPNPETRSRKRSAIVGEYLVPDDQSLQTLQSILTGANGLEARPQDWPSLPIPPLAQLSPAQEEAVRAAIFGPDMTLIQGPPGTGKTTVILEILRQLFRLHGRNQGFKVLLVAPTHVAVDNVLERLAAPRRGSSLVMELGVAPYRVGSTLRIAEHLRGFTPDCINTEYRHRLERDVAEAVRLAKLQAMLDRDMIDTTAKGAKHDRIAWENALQSGELQQDGWYPSWPQELEAEWRRRVTTQLGRIQAWRHWRARGAHPEQRAELLRRWLDFLRSSPRFFSELLVANANLVCATTIGCATREVRAASYDYVIVDEAGKEEARRLLVPLIRGERWVLVGDHQQLPPYADDELQDRLVREGLDPRIVTRSLFEELQAPFVQRGRYVFLDRQGRMHPDISAFVSQRFYGGQLHDFPHVASHAIPRPPFLPDNPRLLVLDSGHLPDCSERQNSRGKGFYNPTEARIAAHLLQAFLNLPTWDESCDVGIITPYRRQVEELKHCLNQVPLLRRLVKQGLIHVGTVDSFQGQERDLVIFSCVRSNNRGGFGFANNMQRLNVALSRAKSRLIVLIDGSTVERSLLHSGAQDTERETSNHLAALIKHARQHKGFLNVPIDWQQRWRG